MEDDGNAYADKLEAKIRREMERLKVPPMERPLCVDCRWIVPPKTEDSLCGHPKAKARSRSPVTGAITEEAYGCSFHRMAHFPCGPEGKLFEAAEA